MQEKISHTHDFKSEQTLYCSNKIPAKYLCFNSQCKYPAITCGQPQCSCFIKKHEDCGFLLTQRLVKNVQQKKLKVSQELQKAFTAIDEIYLKMIEKLSQDREKLALTRQNYGISTDQAEFLSYLKNREVQKLNGDFVSKIKKNIKNRVDISGIREAPIIQYWKPFQNSFNGLALSLKKLFTQSNLALNSMKFDWDKMIQLQGYRIEGKKLSKQSHITTKQLALITPSIPATVKTSWAIKINKIYGLISIGITNQPTSTQKKSLTSFQNYQDYRIFSNGNSSSHNRYEQTKGKEFSIKKGDTIHVMYDPENREVKFNRNIRDGFFAIKMPKKSASNFLAFVHLASRGDLVQIVDFVHQKVAWEFKPPLPKPLQIDFGYPLRHKASDNGLRAHTQHQQLSESQNNDMNDIFEF